MELITEKYHLKSSSLSDLLSKEEIAFLKRKMVRQEFAKGELLFKEKSYSKGIYVVRKGKIKIYQTNKNGKQNIVNIYKKGDYFGYRPLLAEEPHPVAAAAMDNVVLSLIPREVFTELLNQSSSIAQKLLVNLSKEFSVWINKMTVFSQYSVKDRVALSLLILNEIYKKNATDLTEVKIVINRDDFANFVGTAKETLVRMLRFFKDEKIIATQGTKIFILKHRTLVKMVNSL